VSLEIICKPSIKPSSESTSIYVPGDPVPAQMPPPVSGAATSGLKEAAGQPSAAGSTKDSGAAVSRPAPAAGQPDEAGMTTDPGAVDPLVASVFHIWERYHPGRSHSPTTSSLGTYHKKQKLGNFNVVGKPTPS
jgi:hypothetical protein